MKLAVTGGAGFIGSAVVRKAVADGHDVLNIDKLTYAANLENLTSVAGNPRYTFAQEDICDQTKMRALISDFAPDAVMHLAAETHVDRSIDGPRAFIDTNIIGTYSLLEAARDYVQSGAAPTDFRFHHISTDEVYGSLGPTGEFTENSPYQPNSPYSAAKASSDMLARAWMETYKVPVVVTNCSNNYGPYQFPEKLIPVVIIAALEGRDIPIYGKGDNVRDWLHVDDHADALLTAAQKGVPGETYNIGGRAERSNLDLVHMICKALDAALPTSAHRPHADLITFVKDRPGHDHRYAINCDKIENELGWSPSVSVEQGIENTVTWYLDNEPWWRGIIARGFDDAKRLGLGS
ncbi:MAG: dTDP-glucose 4,6-dehydratase [Pseudomonadota bacterium]